jgi:hypothetical protein
MRIIQNSPSRSHFRSRHWSIATHGDPPRHHPNATFASLEPVWLSNQLRLVDLHGEEQNGLYKLFVEFYRDKWPYIEILGDEMAPGQLYLHCKGLVCNFSYIKHKGIWYGAFHHSSGRGYYYEYIGQDHYGAHIEWILSANFADHSELRIICVIIRWFQSPEVEPEFSWSRWWVCHLIILP